MEVLLLESIIAAHLHVHNGMLTRLRLRPSAGRMWLYASVSQAAVA
jgi:hypothetical protein